MEEMKYSNIQLISLVLLRMLIGWHLLYEGLTKILNHYWSAGEYLSQSTGLLSGLFRSIAANPDALTIVNVLNEWGLILIGLGLIVGVFTRFTTMLAFALLILYYISNPPLIGLSTAMPVEGSYLIVNKTLVEAAALFVLFLFPTGHIIGLDVIINKILRRNQ